MSDYEARRLAAPTLVERRAAVVLDLLSFPDKSDRSIASKTGTSREMVAKYRQRMIDAGTLIAGNHRRGGDGKIYPTRRGRL